MLHGGPLSPQGIGGKDQDLVLGLGHLNNSYNFSVSVRGCLQPLPSTERGPPMLRPPLPSVCPTAQFHVVIGSRAEEGQYNLNFHNCYNSVPGREQPFDITVSRGEEGGQQVRGALTAGQVLRAHLGDGKTEAQKQGVGQGESGRAADSHSGPRKSGASARSPCPPLSPPQVMIREKNPEGFLSAAEIPLFKLYMVMSACFLASGIFWVSILCKNT